MKTSSRQFRHGFLDCGILFLLIACAVAVIVMVKSAGPDAPGVAQAGTAVAGLTSATDATPSVAAAPAVDVPVVDPDAGGGLWELLEDILDAL